MADDDPIEQLTQRAAEFMKTAHKLAWHYVQDYSSNPEAIERLQAFDPKLAELVRDLTAGSIASLWQGGHLKGYGEGNPLPSPEHERAACELCNAAFEATPPDAPDQVARLAAFIRQSGEALIVKARALELVRASLAAFRH